MRGDRRTTPAEGRTPVSGDERLERLQQAIEDALTPQQVELAQAKLDAYKQSKA